MMKRKSRGISWNLANSKCIAQESSELEIVSRNLDPSLFIQSLRDDWGCFAAGSEIVNMYKHIDGIALQRAFRALQMKAHDDHNFKKGF